MVKCADGCGTTLSLDEPNRGEVYVSMAKPGSETRWCSMYLDPNGIVELVGELQEVLKQMGAGPND